MAKNSNLTKAKSAKNDEFYTRLTDIEKELYHYREFFKGKIVLCNCNDGIHNSFGKYFSLNFEFLGLKKLICTSYGEDAKKFVYTGDKNGNKVPDLDEWEITPLEGDGSFNSAECIELLKECDVVVTNPPFSLFREFISTIMQYNKKFLVIGNMNAITYKEIFPLIKDNKLWLGYGFQAGNAYFSIDKSNNAEYATGVYDEETGLVKFRNCHWFTNIDTEKRNTPLDLYKKYNSEDFPKYDNYDAIECSKTIDIPMDYDGVIGVPITFLDKYCPAQFEIVELGNSRENFTPIKDYINPLKHTKDGKVVNGNAINCVLAIEYDTMPNGVYYTSDNSKYLFAPYARILIRRKKD